MLKLFAVMLGGRAPGCNTELHDVVFVVGKTIEETYPKLVAKWFGDKKRLHIDVIAEVKVVDGHEIKLSKEKTLLRPMEKLFFINYGGYEAGLFGEKHTVKFYVGVDPKAIAQRAKQELAGQWLQPHCDDNLSVDDVLLNHLDIPHLF